MAAPILYKGYPDKVGRREIFAGTLAGPAAYVVGGDPLLQFSQYHYYDTVNASESLSGLYRVRVVPATLGPRGSFKVIWVLVSSGAEVAAGTVLSGETVVVGGFCGVY